MGAMRSWPWPGGWRVWKFCSRVKGWRRELRELTAWYNTERPHMSLGGQISDGVYHARFPANRKPRFEPRLHACTDF
jgi:transposase InsO family protein